MAAHGDLPVRRANQFDGLGGSPLFDIAVNLSVGPTESPTSELDVSKLPEASRAQEAGIQ